MDLIPVTILTGFLGAGKTTLLQRVLTELHGQKIAVIENEFGEESIDNELLLTETKEQVVQLNNGCICCSIREDLRSALVMLVDKRWKGELNFDRVIIETTGLADPGPVAQTFFIDDEVASCYMLDSVITVVDAKHGDQTLTKQVEAQKQVGFADQIFISKSDLVDEKTLSQLKHRLRHMNPRAPQKEVHFGEVSLSEVLDLNGFNLNAKLDIDPEFLGKEKDKPHDACAHGCGCGDEHCMHEHEHDHDCGCGHDHNHEHGHEGHCCQGDSCACTDHDHDHHHEHSVPDDEVKSFIFRSMKVIDPNKLEVFLGEIIQVYGPQLLRYKGILNIAETDHKVVFQGVHELMGSDLGPQWQAGEPKETKMVFIGVDLPQAILMQGLNECLV